MKLELGYKHHSVLVRKEVVAVNGAGGLRIAFLTDLHLNGYSRRLVEVLIHQVQQAAPDLILLGGDYADSRAGFQLLRKLLASFGEIPAVGIMGNHDLFMGSGRVIEADVAEAVTWLDRSSVSIVIHGQRVTVSPDRSVTGSPTDLNILLLHQPVSPGKIPGHHQIILAGHLHGCQVVLWEQSNRLYPGACFYRNNFTRRSLPQAEYIISRGLGDTLPVRYNCPREIVMLVCEPRS